MLHVVYIVDHDGHKKGKEYTIERTLGERVCEKGLAMPYSDWVQKKVEEKRLADETKLNAEKSKPKVETKPVKKKENAGSKRFSKREKKIG
jgi:hypothetical protein